MKQTSIDKLSSIYNYLVTSERPDLAQWCTDIIRAEEMANVRKGKFDIYKYTADDQVRPSMNGVFHDNGYKIASNAHILVAIKEEYNPEYEGKILYNDGSIAPDDVTFPKWRCVIPQPDGYNPYKVDVNKFRSYVADKRAEDKAKCGKGVKWSDKWNVKVGPATLRAKLFDLFLVAMDEIGATEIMVKNDMRSVYAKTDKGVVLLMPVCRYDTDGEVFTLA